MKMKGLFIMEQRFTQLIKKIESDPSIVEKLFTLETAAEVQSSLKEQGLEFTLEEIDALREALVKTIEKGASDELSDDELEDVAGGAPLIATAAGAAIKVVADTVAVTWNVINRSRW